jgi:surface protein
MVDISRMFQGCESLTSLDLSKFNTKNVEDFSFLFYNCEILIH